MIDYEKLAFECEKIMMPWGLLDVSGCPSHLVKLAKETNKEGIPVGYGKHPKHGWFVVCSSGQGPMVRFE